MSFAIVCPHCHSRLTAKSDKVVGKSMPCPKCKQVFTVEITPPEAPQPAEPKAPKAEAPKAVAPKPAAPKAAAPKSAVPKPAAPKSGTPQPAPKPTAPKAKPKTETPKAAAASDETDLGNLDLSNFDTGPTPGFGDADPFGSIPESSPLDAAFPADPLGMVSLDSAAQAQPLETPVPITPVRRPAAPAAAEPKPLPKGNRKLLIGLAVGGGVLTLLLIALGVGVLMTRSGTSEVASGSPPAPAGNAPASTNNASAVPAAAATPAAPPGDAAAPTPDAAGNVDSAVLRKRLEERIATQVRQQNPSASADEIAKVLAGEIAAKRSKLDKFLVLPAKHEATLQAGQPLPNSKPRVKLVLSLRGVEFPFEAPPGMEPTDVETVTDPVDAELTAQYIDYSLIKLFSDLNEQRPVANAPALMKEMIQVLREEDLSAMKYFADVERLAQSRVAKVQQQVAASSTDPKVMMQVSLNNLKQIGLAFHNYHDTYKRFPAAVQIGPKDVPHSWRITILPYLENQLLFNRYRQDEPWDSPHNKALLTEMPAVYRAPGLAPGSSETAYVGFTPPDLSAPPAPWMPLLCGTRAHPMADITDGTTNCILAVESKTNIPWTQPADLPVSAEMPVPAIGGIYDGGFCGLVCDGRAMFFPDSYDRGMLARVLLPSDGEPVEMPGDAARREEAVAQQKEAQNKQRALAASTNPADRKTVSQNNLRQIALAIHNYHDTYKQFPAAVQVGPKDVPHSWRVTILPFMGQQELFDKYRQDEPWDSLHNRALLPEMPDTYRAPSAPREIVETVYVGFTPTTPYDSRRPEPWMPLLGGTHSLRLADVLDGTSQTVLLVESKTDIAWTQPQDLPISAASPVPEMGGIHEGGFYAALVDGRVTFVPESYDREMLRRALMPRDGEPVEMPEEWAQKMAEKSARKKLTKTAKPADWKMISFNNLKQIGMALHNYHDTYKAFPAAVQIGPQDVPHSWRVSLLPFIDEADLHSRYHQDEPWDSPHNRALLVEMPDIYRAPNANPNETNTAYFGFGFTKRPDSFDDGLRPVLAGTENTRIASIIDGMSNCIITIETKLDVPWTQPMDIPYDPRVPLPKLGGIHKDGFWAGLSDASVTFFPNSFNRAILLKAIQRGDGSPIKLPEPPALQP